MRTGPDRCGRRLGALVAALVLSSCGRDFAPERLDGPVATTYAADLAGTVAAVGDLTRDLGVLRARCLHGLGFPQPLQALGVGQAPGSDPLRIDPGDFGPSTRAEADRFGMIGSELAANGSVGAVVANDPAFDAAAHRCDDWIYGVLVPGLRGLQSEAAAFVDDVRARLVHRVSRAVEPSLRVRVDCTRRAGYPGLTTARFLRAGSMQEVLRHAGVEAGRITGAREVPRREHLRRGEIVVLPPAPTARYVPSPDEVRFARVYVDCGHRAGFTRTSRLAVDGARSVLEDVMRGASDVLRRRLVAALARMHAPGG